MKKSALLAALAVLAASQPAQAESDVNTAAGANISAAARLDFQITIPRVLFLQVGTGTHFADNTSVDRIDFTVPAANLGDGTDVAGTGGDLTGGAVRVRIFGNNGNVQLTAATDGALSNGIDTIPWSEIKVAASAPGAPAAGYIATAIPHPTIPSSGTGAATTITATNNVIRQEGIWTFSYDNTVAYAAGTYGGTNTNNSRIVYTATLP